MQKKKTAVITGASTGIGRAIATALSGDNYSVVNADITTSDSDHADYVKCDVTSSKDIDNLYSYVNDKYGIPDVLISNAGQGIHEKLAEGDPEKWKKVIDINLIGALRFIRAFLSQMQEQNDRDIVFISSIAAEQPYEYGGIYSASKAALNMVADTLRLEAKKVRVSVISPGVVNTEFFTNMISSNHTVEDIGLGSLSAKKVAEMVLGLLNLPSSASIPKLIITPKDQR